MRWIRAARVAALVLVAAALAVSGTPSLATAVTRTPDARTQIVNHIPIQLPQALTPGQTVFWYKVHHTRANGMRGLSFHPSPSYTDPRVTRVLHDGDTVGIVCQTRGQPVGDNNGWLSDIWDRTVQGDNGSDIYISTPGMIGTSPPIIPECRKAESTRVIHH